MLPIIGPPLACSTAVAVALAALPASLDRLWWLQLLIGAGLLAACLAAFERRAIVKMMRSVLARGGVDQAAFGARARPSGDEP